MESHHQEHEPCVPARVVAGVESHHQEHEPCVSARVGAGVESHHQKHEPCVSARVGCRYGLVWSHTAGREHGCLNVLYLLASVVASVVCIEFLEVQYLYSLEIIWRLQSVEGFPWNGVEVTSGLVSC